MDVVGFSLPSTSLQLEPRTIWVSLLVGTLVTVVAALVPARRATKVLPVEALRESTPGAREAVEAARRHRAGDPRLPVPPACSSALYGGADMKVFGLGLLAALVGVMVALPLAVRPLAALIGSAAASCAACPASWRSRTRRATRVVPPSTAAALMIGLTLVVSMGVFASSLKASFGDVLVGPDQRRPVRRRRPAPRPRASARGDQGGPGGRRGRRGLGQRLGRGPLRRRGLELLRGRPGHRRGGHEPRRSRRARSPTSARTASWCRSRPRPRTAGSWATRSRRSSPRPASTGCTWSAIYDGKGWIGDDFVLSIDEQNAFAGPQLCRPRWSRSPPAPTRRHGPGRHRGRPGRPPGRPGAGPEGLREGGQRVHRPAAHLRHRDAAAGGGDRAAGHRQHAGAVGLRAHPRAGSAPRGRHDPRPGPGDGPLGVGR